jgi:polysaccharide biosynthesis/export protein
MTSVNQYFALLPDGGWQRLLCDALWQSALIASLGWLAAQFLVRHAAVRAWVLLLTATACIVVPLASAASRSAGWTVLARAEVLAKNEAGEKGRRGEGEIVVGESPMNLLFPAEVTPADGSNSVPAMNAIEPTATEQKSAPVPATQTASTAPIPPFSPAPILTASTASSPKINWLHTLAFAWLTASALLALRLILSALSVRKILRHTKPCDDGRLRSAAAEAAARVGLREAPPVLVSDLIESPMVLALGKPRLLVPHSQNPLPLGESRVRVPDGSAQHPHPIPLPEGEGDNINWTAAFTHELAHVARRDGLSRLWMELIAIALPLQPLVWLVRRNFHLACEEACDDWSVAAGSDPVDLAETLTAWLGRRTPKPATAIGMSSTKARVLRLLAMREKPIANVPRASRFAALTAVLLLISGLAIAQVPATPHPSPTTPRPPKADLSGAEDEERLIDAELDSVPSIVDLNKQIADSYGALSSASSAAKSPARDGAVRKLQRQIADLEQQFEKLRDRLRPKIVEKLSAKRSNSAAQNLPAANEQAMVALPQYTIEPPDILLVDLLKAVPREPLRIAPFDKLRIETSETGTPPPVGGEFTVDSTGRVILNPGFGTVKVQGLTRAEAENAITKHLCEIFKNPAVSLTVDESRMTKGIAGEHLVAPDGTVNFGAFGTVNIRGMSVPEASAAVEQKLAEHFESIMVAVDVFAYNSKVYYVIVQGQTTDGGDCVQRFPITGNETVLDAISQVQGLHRMSSKNIWISRPSAEGKPDQILRVRWDEIVAGGGTCTNYQVFPGDRVFIGASAKSAELAGQLVSDQVWPAELEPYVIESPDLVVINAVRIVPKQPYSIQPLDVLSLQVTGVAPADEIRNLYLVEPNGHVNLGPTFGKVKVGGLLLEAATAALTKHFAGTLKDPKVTLALSEAAAQSQIHGEHLVAPDGAIRFDKLGSVRVAGMTADAAKEAIEKHLSQHFDEPIVSVDVQSKSKVYHVILHLNEGRYGDNILWFPATGKDTVLDAIAKIGGLRGLTEIKVWIERPSPDKDAHLTMHMTAEKLLQRGSEANLRLLPGDRLVIQGESIRRRPDIELPRSAKSSPHVEKFSVELKFRATQPKRSYDETYELEWSEGTTVLDAIKELGTLDEFTGATVSVRRGVEQLPVNLSEIKGGDNKTNHKLKPGDRLIIDGIDEQPPDPSGRFPQGFQTF